MPTKQIPRRDMLKQSIGGLALSASMAPPLAAMASTSNTFQTDQGFEDFAAYFRIISDLEGPSTYRYHAGKVLMVPEPRGLAEDFVDFVAIKQDRSRRLPNGDFQHAYTGVTMFTDMETGRVLDTFENPVTGETVTVEPFATSGGSIVYTPEGPYALKPGADPTFLPKISEVGPTKFDWDVSGDDVWITYPERFAVFNDDGKAIAADNSMYRYMTDMAQLMDPAISSVDCVMNWQTETGPWSWMNMPDSFKGHFIFGSMGRKYASLNRVPTRYIEASETRYPEHLLRPIDWADFVIPNSRR